MEWNKHLLSSEQAQATRYMPAADITVEKAEHFFRPALIIRLQNPVTAFIVVSPFESAL
jgi:hypothetical protein